MKKISAHERPNPAALCLTEDRTSQLDRPILPIHLFRIGDPNFCRDNYRAITEREASIAEPCDPTRWIAILITVLNTYFLGLG